MADNTIHALSQSISFGKFMSENLEWGKWSTFSHKKYVEEAEKYSRPGSVAQKKAFFEAHYKRIAEAKKAATEEQPTVTPAEVLLHTLETQPPLSLLPEEEPLERKSIQKDEDVLLIVDDSLEEKKKLDEEVVVLKEDCSVGEKEKEKTKNKPVFRLSLEKTIPPAKSLEIASSKKTSERPMIQSSGVQRQKFNFLSCFIGNAKTRDQNQSMKKIDLKLIEKMGESAVLAHSYSFAAPITRPDSHEDNTIHALSQSISFGKFMSENLEWGKWSTFSHKKYVEEAEKYSRPGSRIAEAKKAATEEQPTVTPAEVLLHTLETQPPLSLLPEEEPLERKSIQKDEDVLLIVDDSLEEKKKLDEEVVVLKEDCSVGEKEKEKTKNKPVFRLSLEKTIPPAKSLEIASSKKTSERPMIQSSGVQRQKFNFLSCFIGNAKTRDQNQSMRKMENRNQKKKQFMCLCLKPKTVRES
ncbi:hypothetical protein Bca52824_071296 [Brassica carinata]|uniref:Protein WVD2-like 7 n=1 Tax=Brassica carinata TaxID=52824 RepID=A0A8X7Q6F7_BRACI|nr:hypothetical protein Bca52824_071296 [Brassica carinata]